MKNEINLIEGIIEDWHNLADYDGKEKDGESLDTAWAKIKEIIQNRKENIGVLKKNEREMLGSPPPVIEIKE